MPTSESEHHVLGETTLVLDGLPIQVTITDWLTYADRFRVYHFAFRSPDGKPNTLSPTGYQSHHLTTESVLDFAELETYARDYCRSRSALRDADPNQLSLFDSNRDRKVKGDSK